MPGISLALNDFGPDDVPDVTPRPLDELVAWADSANEYRDQGRDELAGRDLGTLLTELQVHALTAGSADRVRAFTALVHSCTRALVHSCVVAGDVANRIAGNIDLSVSAARCGYDMACRLGDPGLIGFTRWCWALHLMWLTTRGRASRVLTEGIDELGPSVYLRSEDTLPAEMLGMMHLVAAQCAARGKQHDDAHAHLAARDLVITLDRRAKRRVWELDSLRNGFGVGGQGPRSVNN